MGCQKVSPGCENCYAEKLVTGRMQLPVWGPPKTTKRQRTSAATWKLPARWHRAALRAGVRRRVFVASLADVFEDHPDLVPWRAEALAILAQCTALDVQLLTKRPENVVRMVPPAWLEHWPRHVWIGCTVEDQRRADERIPELLKVPAAVRFLSCEPLLEPVKLEPWLASGTACPECGGYGEDVSSRGRSDGRRDRSRRRQ
jgi:protein gp37